MAGRERPARHMQRARLAVLSPDGTDFIRTACGGAWQEENPAPGRGQAALILSMSGYDEGPSTNFSDGRTLKATAGLCTVTWSLIPCTEPTAAQRRVIRQK
jgi:hypothetical protein